MKKFKKLCYCC